MNHEQKYNEALERARIWQNHLYDTNDRDYADELNYIFPELKESEDERIKRTILELVSIAGNGNQFEEIKDWLEKQGEQTTDKIEPKFKVGDWVIDDFGNIYQIETATEIESEHIFGYTIVGGGYFNDNSNVRLWTINDAKNGDVLYSLDSKQPFIYKERPQFSQARGHCCINKFGEFAIWNTSKCVICTDKYIPATKEQRDLLFQKMKEAGYEWDAEKKELKKIEPKKLDADEVIKWLEKHTIDWKGQELIKTFTPNSPAAKSYIVEQFKQDFGL